MYRHILLPSFDPAGNPILSVIAKARFAIKPDGQCVAVAEPAPLIKKDVHFPPGDPLTNACEIESDMVAWKARTDIIVIGMARAPRNREVIQMGVSVAVGAHRKTIVVIGDRRVSWKPIVGPVFSEPRPFTEMEIRYERAYGGVDVLSTGGAAPMAYPRNLIGCGYVIQRKKDAVQDLLLPNIEDPAAMLTPDGLCVLDPSEWHRMPFPAGLGVFGKGWYPRSSFAGGIPASAPIEADTYEVKAGLIPAGHIMKAKSLRTPTIDARFFNGGSQGLVVPFLSGKEPVRIEGMSAEGPLQFNLPGVKPEISIRYGDGPRFPETVLHTVVIRVEERTLDLTWRGSTTYPGMEVLDENPHSRIAAEVN